MDNQDRDFEVFLRQFHLRRTGSFLEERAQQKIPAGRKTHRWFLAAAAVLVAALLSVPLVRNSVQPASDVIRADGEVSTVSLPDGSQVEMRPQSELTLQSTSDSARVVLRAGGILVTAAPTFPRWLQVETHDTIVTSTAAVFFVETQQSGTRVAVVEGEVEVRQQHDANTRKIARGEQISTDPALQAQPLTEAIAWSSAGSLLSEPGGLPLPPIDAESRRKEKASPLKKVMILPQETAGPPSPQAEPRPAPAPEAPLPALVTTKPFETEDTKGKDIFGMACGACHPLQLVESKRYDSRDAYTTLVQQQVAMGAAVGQADVPILVDYLWRTYGIRRFK